MVRLPIQILVLSIIATSSVISFKGYDDDFVSFGTKTDACVSHSGNQELCDNYLACTKKLPKQLENEFNTCISNVYPDGLYKCNDSHGLFGSPDEYMKYLQCFMNKLPQKSSLSDAQQKQFGEYTKCIQKRGGKCLKDQGISS
ncbi:uncharacterized protein TNCT_638141 [Trichonephila clavata]|uniref:Uncharacterized protein n=1 Tax=Trichonephila clavata TaxID=2740835 RepID=A0A8X6G6U0_TRICU|nr:uncharacterized protein TNCT_638141 [Trichonephila clavata]